MIETCLGWGGGTSPSLCSIHIKTPTVIRDNSGWWHWSFPAIHITIINRCNALNGKNKSGIKYGPNQIENLKNKGHHCGNTLPWTELDEISHCMIYSPF